MSYRSIFLVLILLLGTAGVAALLSSCTEQATDDGAADAPETAATTPGASPDVYRVRGQVVELPDPDNPMSGFYIHHEAIDDFKNADGEIVGMDSMTMPFPVADSLSFEGIEEGSSVVITLEVNWEADPTLLVTEIEALPEGTEIESRKAATEGATES